MSLLDRFLRYSLQHGRPIKALLMLDGQPKSMNLTVQEIREDGILYLSARSKKQPRLLPWEDLLSASYARGDEGDTLRNVKEPTDD